MKFGDECTDFFHAHATIKHSRSVITSLQDSQGNVLSTHEQKAELLWNCYKEKLGTSESVTMLFDLNELLQVHENLDCLHQPFTKEEIDEVIKDMPTHKSPGPDGFNIDFVKKCRPLIAEDFYNLC